MTRIADDTNVSCLLLGRELDAFERENTLIRHSAGRGRFTAVAQDEIAFETKPIIPIVCLAQSDQIGGAVEAITHQADFGAGRQPGGNGFQKRLLNRKADRPFGFLDPPGQRQRPLPMLEGQHQHLMPIRHLGLIHNQNNGLAVACRALDHLAGERLHDDVRIDQRIAQHPRYPLVTHVRPVGLARQSGRQVHQISTANIEHRGHQKGQVLTLGLALRRQDTFELVDQTKRYRLDAAHAENPTRPKGGLLESHNDSKRQSPNSKLMDDQVPSPSHHLSTWVDPETNLSRRLSDDLDGDEGGAR